MSKFQLTPNRILLLNLLLLNAELDGIRRIYAEFLSNKKALNFPENRIFIGKTNAFRFVTALSRT